MSNNTSFSENLTIILEHYEARYEKTGRISFIALGKSIEQLYENSKNVTVIQLSLPNESEAAK